MVKSGFFARHLIVLEYIKEDIFYFAIPGLIVFVLGLIFSVRDGYEGMRVILWNLIMNPQSLLTLSVNNIVGLILIIAGFSIMLVGMGTLRMFYASTLVIRENHELRTHGIYRFIRHPVYFGFIVVVIGISMAASSLYGFLVMLLEIPICLSRIRIEQKMLVEEFGDEYRNYMKTTKKLFPFIY